DQAAPSTPPEHDEQHARQKDRAALEALREHCHGRVAKCRTRAGWDRWTSFDDVLQAILAGEPGAPAALAALCEHCRRQAARLAGRPAAGQRWQRWLAAVE